MYMNKKDDHRVKYSRNEYRNEYLKSPEWKKLRDGFLRGKTQCERCGEQKPLDVHHCNYRNIVNVKQSDLLAVCRDCHKLIEKAKKLKMLTNRHTRKDAMRVNEKRVEWRSNSKIKITSETTRKIPKINRLGQQLICGILKIRQPMLWEELNGMKISRLTFDKIQWTIRKFRYFTSPNRATYQPKPRRSLHY